MSDERVRLFVALELPPDVREQLLRWRDAALRSLPGLRAVAAESLHVTLCFLGSRAADEIDEIAAACETVSAYAQPKLGVGGARWLPPRRPRVLAVELDDSSGACAQLQAELSSVLHAGGWYEPESRPFLAHVTVARAIRGARVRGAELEGPPPIDFRAPTVTLYRSRPGSRYEALRRVELG